MFTYGHPADIDYDKRLDESWAKSVGIREVATARFKYQLSDDWKTRVTYGWNNDRYSLSIAQPSSLTGNNLRRAANGAHYDDETRYASWDFMGQQELFGQRHDLLIGADTEASDQFCGKPTAIPRNRASTSHCLFMVFWPSPASSAPAKAT